MIISKYILVFIPFFFTLQSVSACESPAQIEGSHRAILHEQIYFGRIASIAIPELEKVILPEDSKNYLSRSSDKVVRVKVYKTLKGKSKDIIVAKLSWCNNDDIKLGNIVAIFGNGKHWEAVNNRTEIAIIRKTLTRQ